MQRSPPSFPHSPLLSSPLNNSFFEAAISQVRSTIAYLGEYSYWEGGGGGGGEWKGETMRTEYEILARDVTSRALISFPPVSASTRQISHTTTFESWIVSIKKRCSISIGRKGGRGEVLERGEKTIFHSREIYLGKKERKKIR